MKSLSRVWLFVTPWTVAYQALPSMRFSRQEYWSGLPFPSPGDLPNPGIEPGSPALQTDALPSEPPGKPFLTEHSKNSSYLDQNSPQYCYRGLLSCSVSNSVKFSSEFRCSLTGGKHLQVSTVQSIPKATALGSGEEWAWIFAGCLIYPLKTGSTSSKW